MRKVSSKFVEKFKTHFVLNRCLGIRTIYEIMWKNMVEQTGHR